MTKKEIDGEEYELGLVGYAGFPPEAYTVYNKDREYMFVPCA